MPSGILSLQKSKKLQIPPTAGSSFHYERRQGGFTLIELTVVVVIIGLTMALTMPRFRYNLLSDELKSSTRHLAGLITNLSKEAVREHRDYLLYLDLSGNQYWTETPDMTAEGRMLAREKTLDLPEDIRILDVLKKGDEKNISGEVPIMITKRGYLQPAMIHLGDDKDRTFTLRLKTFAGRVEILEGYVDYEEQ